MKNKLIVKIYEVAAGQLLVNIPKKSGLQAGDYVVIRKLELFDMEGKVSIGVEMDEKKQS